MGFFDVFVWYLFVVVLVCVVVGSVMLVFDVVVLRFMCMLDFWCLG